MKIRILSGPLGAVALVVAASAGAQELVVDDCAVPLDPSAPVEFETDGDISVTTTGARPACLGVAGGGGAVAVATSATSVGAGETFDVDYAVPDNYLCTLRKGASILLSNAQIQRPTGIVSDETISANTIYNMQCELDNALGTVGAFANTLVTYTGGGGGGGVGDQGSGTPCAELPLGSSRQPATDFRLNNAPPRTAADYVTLFGAWPLGQGNSSGAFDIDINRDQYLSLPFTVPTDAQASEYILFQWFSGPFASNGTVVSVSECVGGIIPSQAVPQTAPGDTCHAVGTSTSGTFIMGVDTANAQCVLEPGKSYYLNVMDYNLTTGESTCDRGECTWVLTTRGTTR